MNNNTITCLPSPGNLRKPYRKERSLITNGCVQKLNQLPSKLTCLNPWVGEEIWVKPLGGRYTTKKGKGRITGVLHITMWRWMVCTDMFWTLGWLRILQGMIRTPSGRCMKPYLNWHEDHKESNTRLLGRTTMKCKWSGRSEKHVEDLNEKEKTA